MLLRVILQHCSGTAAKGLDGSHCTSIGDVAAQMACALDSMPVSGSVDHLLEWNGGSRETAVRDHGSAKDHNTQEGCILVLRTKKRGSPETTVCKILMFT